MRNIYHQKFILENAIVLAANSTPGGFIVNKKKSAKSDTILYYMSHEKFPLF